MTMSIEKGATSAALGLAGTGALVFWPDNWWIAATLMVAGVFILVTAVELKGQPIWRWWPNRSPLKIIGLDKVGDSPSLHNTALRLTIKNTSKQGLSGVRVRLFASEPDLEAFPDQHTLPLQLLTKEQMDSSGPNQLIPNASFDLPAGCEESVIVLWAGTNGALELYFRHSGGLAEFLFLHSLILWVDVAVGRWRTVAPIQFACVNQETGAWGASLLDKNGLERARQRAAREKVEGQKVVARI